jgi:hypothetical protein
MPPDSPDLETAKLMIASRFKNFEIALNDEIVELANSGFADQRLCAIAKTDFEKAFLTLEKAIRIGAPNEYAKQPYPDGHPKFVPPVDPLPQKNTGVQDYIGDQRNDKEKWDVGGQ